MAVDFELMKNNLMNKYIECSNKYGISKEKYLKRYEHSLRVVDMAILLNNLYNFGLDEDKLITASIYHDYAKFCSLDDYKKIIDKYNLDKNIIKKSPKILHALLGCYIVKDELNIDDIDILDAIRTHSTGDSEMTILQEVIYLSDCVEIGREGEYFAYIRRLARKNYKKAIAIFLRDNIIRLKNEEKDLDELSVKAFEFYKIYCSKGDDKISQVIDCLDKNLIKDLVVYDSRSKSPFFDYILVATTTSSRQMNACVSYLEDDFIVKGAEIGDDWTLIDLGDIIIHVFKEEERQKYGLDKLYVNLPTIRYEKN